MHVRRFATLILAAGLIVPTAFAQSGSGQDMKNAGGDTKNAAKDTGHGVAQATKKASNTVAGRSTAKDQNTKADMKGAGTETKDAAKNTGHGVKKGTKKAYNKTKSGTKKAADKVSGRDDDTPKS